SPVFKKMFEIDMKEKITGIVEINDMRYEVTMTILEHIYFGHLPIHGRAKEVWSKYPCEVIYAADKYELTYLKRFCEENIMEICTKENAKDLFESARLFKFGEAKKLIWEFIQKYVNLCN